MSTEIIKERSATFNLAMTAAQTQAPDAADLGATYEEVVLMVTPTEAAKMTDATTIGLLVDDKEVYNPSGALVAIAKPAANAGIHMVFRVGSGRTVNVILSGVPAATFTVQVYGNNRLVIDPNERWIAQKATI